MSLRVSRNSRSGVQKFREIYAAGVTVTFTAKEILDAMVLSFEITFNGDYKAGNFQLAGCLKYFRRSRVARNNRTGLCIENSLLISLPSAELRN